MHIDHLKGKVKYEDNPMFHQQHKVTDSQPILNTLTNGFNNPKEEIKILQSPDLIRFSKIKPYIVAEEEQSTLIKTVEFVI
jgi:hypothetical protein